MALLRLLSRRIFDGRLTRGVIRGHWVVVRSRVVERVGVFHVKLVLLSL